MNRFEKKCFIGSATFHGLLLVVFFCGSAFLSSDKPRDMGPVITIDNIKVTDGQTRGGGNPNAQQEPPPPAPQPEPPPPQPQKKEIVKHEEEKPKLNEPKPIDKSDLLKVAKKTPEKDSSKSLLTKPVKRTDTNFLAQLKRDADERARREKAEAMRLAAERKQFTDAVNGIVGGVGKSISKSTVAEVQGPGGEAYVNYGSLIGETYKRAVLSSQPQSDNDEEAVIRVVVARSGVVRDSQWVRRTANPVLNKAVDRAMTSVRSLPEFPPGSKDSERTFTIRIFVEARKVSA